MFHADKQNLKLMINNHILTHVFALSFNIIKDNHLHTWNIIWNHCRRGGGDTGKKSKGKKKPRKKSQIWVGKKKSQEQKMNYAFSLLLE